MNQSLPAPAKEKEKHQNFISPYSTTIHIIFKTASFVKVGIRI